jgi:UDP-N-acetylmuramoyl-L-alanyl-D-glutamate--2,6-diaminopimelate ligase
LKNFLRRFLGNDNAFLLFYHRLKAILAVLIYRFPSRNLIVIGVTGTNGKTTTCNVLTHLLEASGYRVGMLSSINMKVGNQLKENATKMSTQSPFVVQKLLREMVKAGCTHAVIEVTSHAVTQSRVYGINFDVGVFTNISEDHLDYHGSFANYLEAKARFIGSLQGMRRKRGVPKVLVLNNDDPEFAYFDQFNADKKYTFGLDKGVVVGSELKLLASGSEFRVVAPNVDFLARTKLIGDFNVYNCLAAISVCLSQGISLETIAQGLKTMHPLPGRYEPVAINQPYTVIVDYAHTEDALAKLCTIFRGLTVGGGEAGSADSKLILVFGCTGGGRDKAKRPKMGKVAAELADIVILTNDDPYEENELEIIEQIAAGIERAEGDRLYKIVDRRLAIELAMSLAGPGDTILLAGKGSEPVIALGDKLLPWDDRTVVRELADKNYVMELN